tara:strand:+ start:1502 stop:2272 length:771 start_codon:yes stop_codon:yes gene_type:complete
MHIFRNTDTWTAYRKQLSPYHSLGIVMTMGALHQGHLSLIQKSMSENDKTLVTLFVNPTQFDDMKDYQDYPNQWEQDITYLKQINVDYLLAPHAQQMHSKDDHFHVIEQQFSQKLCGLSRHGHFSGVLTVVMKLLQLAQAHRAYFGEKDYQQYTLIKMMVESFFVPTEVIVCPTIRDENGLALSSRNQHLSQTGRIQAGIFAHILHTTPDLSEVRKKLSAASIKIDYLAEYYGRRFAAVFIEDIRLIDNIDIKSYF